MRNILRKKITVKHKEDYMYCLTYNLQENIIVENLQCWIDEKKQSNFDYLYRIQQLFRGIEINSEDKVYERTMLNQLNSVDSFECEIETFNTQTISNSMKPHRNYVLITVDEIEQKINDYIES